MRQEVWYACLHSRSKSQPICDCFEDESPTHPSWIVVAGFSRSPSVRPCTCQSRMRLAVYYQYSRTSNRAHESEHMLTCNAHDPTHCSPSHVERGPSHTLPTNDNQSNRSPVRTILPHFQNNWQPNAAAHSPACKKSRLDICTRHLVTSLGDWLMCVPT